MKEILDVIAYIFNVLLWKVLFFGMFVLAIYTARKAQKNIAGTIDWLDLIRDPVAANISYIRFAIMVALVSSTYIYILACTAANATIQDKINFTLAYLGVWVTGQVINKIAERPPSPIIQQQQQNNPNPTILNQGDVNVGKQE